MFMDIDYLLYSDVETIQEGENPTIIFLLHRKFCESLNKQYDYLECPICMDDLNDNKRVLLLDCNHETCVGCINKLIKMSLKEEKGVVCPICRKKVTFLKTKTTNLEFVYSNLIYTSSSFINYSELRIHSQGIYSIQQNKRLLRMFITLVMFIFVIMTSNFSHNQDK